MIQPSLAELLSLDSAYAKDICQLCAEMCNACANECDKHAAMGMEHCKECAAACRQCANEAMKVYNELQQETEKSI